MPNSPENPDDLREWIVIEDRRFLIEQPGLCDGPDITSTPPYWTALWPGARMLATAILRAPWTVGADALEIGCGLGLPGIVALSVGLRVTFSDFDLTALQFAASNARENGFDHFKTLQLDWRCPPEGLQFPVLLASDVVYEMCNVEPLVMFIQKVLSPGGLCLIAEQDRLPSQAIVETLSDSGLPFTTQVVRVQEPGKKRVKGTLYRIEQRECLLDPPFIAP